MSRRVLVIDNYDSFVHNLARYVRELGGRTLEDAIRKMTSWPASRRNAWSWVT